MTMDLYSEVALTRDLPDQRLCRGDIATMHTLATEALRLERHLSDLVNAAYHLTPDEIALLWQTAPPRMPVGGPGR